MLLLLFFRPITSSATAASSAELIAGIGGTGDILAPAPAPASFPAPTAWSGLGPAEACRSNVFPPSPPDPTSACARGPPANEVCPCLAPAPAEEEEGEADGGAA